VTLTAFSEFLFPAPAQRSTRAIISWWEARRLRFNLIVGTAGVFSLTAINVLAWLPPHGEGLPPNAWRAAVAFGVLANVFYLWGPAVELGIERVWGRKVLPAGPTLFRMGLTFSVGLALLPTLLGGLDWGFRILRWLI
jgi:hypothetical protein